MSKVLRPSAHAFRKAGWMPAHEDAYHDYVKHLRTKIELHRAAGPEAPPLLHYVQQFKDFIELDSVVFADFIRMFEGAKVSPKNHEELVVMINAIVQESPKFNNVGPPVYMILTESMNTHGGFSAYTKEKLNVQFKKLFDEWAKFLASPHSRGFLKDVENGWLTAAAKSDMMQLYDGATFEEVFICDSSAPYYDFTSFDDFFTRRYRAPQLHRPTGPIGDLRVISAACESTSYSFQTNVQRSDQLFIKDEAYSLVHLLANDPRVDEFIGGSVLQGFLHTTGYHRWHAPVNGKITKIVDISGTYFAQAPSTIDTPFPFNPQDPPPFLASLRFLSNTAARQLIFIEADNTNIGIMCFIAIGMGEISSCQATVSVGQHVVRGQELGMFHFGGSSSALVFRAGANIEFDGDAITPGKPLKINEPIASAELQKNT